jgi:hypothetical protein
MKNTFLLILVVAIGILVFLQIKSCEERKYFSGLIQQYKDTTKVWQDEAGRWRAEAQVAQVRQEDMKSFFAEEVRQMQKDFNVKLKDVRSMIVASTYTRDTVELVRDSSSGEITFNTDGGVPRDSAVFRYNDLWASFYAVVGKDKMLLDYNTRDSVAFLSNWKRNGLFKARSLMLDGISYNPKSKIYGIKNVEVKAKESRLGLGLDGSWGYGPGGWGFYVGVGLHYSLVKF